jgi:hypothetical protein
MYTSTVQAAPIVESNEVRVCAPLLIVGAPRSGTTLVQRTLLLDPRCAGGQESHFFAVFGAVLREFDRKKAMPRPHGLACYWTRDQTVSQLRRLWVEAFVPVLAARPSATMLVEKTPDHALWLDVAAEVLPKARVLHVVRDSRAVVASLVRASRTEWGRPWAPKSVSAAIDIWRRHVESALQSRLPTHMVRLEDVIDAPNREFAALSEFLRWGAEPLRVDPVARTASSGDALATSGSRSVFVPGGAVGVPPAEPAEFARSASDARDGWRRELGWWGERRIWKETRDLLQTLGYTRHGLEPRT